MRFVLEVGQVCLIFIANSLIHFKIYFYLEELREQVRQSLRYQDGTDKVQEAIARLRWYPGRPPCRQPSHHISNPRLLLDWPHRPSNLRILSVSTPCYPSPFPSFLPSCSTDVSSWSLSLTQGLVNLQGFFNALVFASVTPPLSSLSSSLTPSLATEWYRVEVLGSVTRLRSLQQRASCCDQTSRWRD